MKTKQIIYGLSTLVLAGSLTLTSCKKKQKEVDEVPDTEQGTISDNNTAESFMTDIVSIGSQGSENGTITTYKTTNPLAEAFFMSPCAAFSITPANKTFTVDFGSTPCLCLDGRYRSGKLFFDYSLSTNTITPIYYRTPGFKMSIASQNYVVDGYTVNISNKTVTNTTPMSIPTGTNPGTNLTWSVSANVSIVKPNGGGTIVWNCTRTRELANTSDPNCYKGQSMPIDWTKARIRLNGSANGTTAGGENYTATITNLVRDFGTCKVGNLYPFISGQLDFTPGTRPTRYIDYGSGTCDRSATVTIKGVTYSFNF